MWRSLTPPRPPPRLHLGGPNSLGSAGCSTSSSLIKILSRNESHNFVRISCLNSYKSYWFNILVCRLSFSCAGLLRQAWWRSGSGKPGGGCSRSTSPPGTPALWVPGIGITGKNRHNLHLIISFLLLGLQDALFIEDAGIAPMTFQDLQGSFALIIMGLLLSVLVFVLETIMPCNWQ